MQSISKKNRHTKISIKSIVNLIVLIVIFFTGTANSCMPGYEGERARLRQYLGIEWVPQGLNLMDGQKPKNVQHPSELNCDFSNPENCKWENVKGLDTLDFYLFRKEDHTEFPMVHIRPGPSKVSVGDQLILTGDKRKEEQNALLVSFPIKCQNDTGKLTFTFWVYNGARVEIDILEEDANHHLAINPEKPQINCGTLQVETECSVDIPPKERPFRIGIHAYDIKNKDGAFVMLDNILYEATFCKASINFGPGFQTEPLITSAIGEFVQTSSQLNCNDFGMACRWRNGGTDDSAIWKRGMSSIQETVLFNETGTYTQPTAPFAFIYIEEGSSNSAKSLISDPIECVSAASSTVISFRIWATRNLNMNICILDMEMKPIECQKVSMARSPATTHHRFQINKPFMFAFQLSPINTDFPNFVIIDDIVHSATTCSEASNFFDLGSDFYTTPMLSVLKNRPVHSSNDLACDFSKRAMDCQWSNLEGEVDTRWEIGLGLIDDTKFASLTEGKKSPGTEIAVAKFLARNSTAVLVSERIQCIVDSSTLSFKYWRTGSASLSVCIVQGYSFEVIDCQAVESWTMEQLVVDIPQFDESIRIALKADSSNGAGIVAIDNIVFEAKICQAIAFSGNSGFSSARKNHHRPSSPVSSAASNFHAIPDENVCRLLSCNFNRDHMCLYSSFRVTGSVSMFRAFKGSATTLLFGRSRMAILESPIFRLNAPARLHFDFSVTKGAADVHVCHDSVMRELDSCFTVMKAKQVSPSDLDNTLHDYIEILPTDTKVYVIAKLDRSSSKASITLDNIELTDVENHKIC